MESSPFIFPSQLDCCLHHIHIAKIQNGAFFQKTYIFISKSSEIVHFYVFLPSQIEHKALLCYWKYEVYRKSKCRLPIKKCGCRFISELKIYIPYLVCRKRLWYSSFRCTGIWFLSLIKRSPSSPPLKISTIILTSFALLLCFFSRAFPKASHTFLHRRLWWKMPA